MRLKVQLSGVSTELNSCPIVGCGWMGAAEGVLTLADDGNIRRHDTARWTKTSGQLLQNNPLLLLQQAKSGSGENDGTSVKIHPTSLHIAQQGTGRKSDGNPTGSRRSNIGLAQSDAGTGGLMLITSSDGRIFLVNTVAEKVEKTVQAHEGAAIAARWSNDPGAAGGFASCGEDGCVKLWSRSGMLRSVLAQLQRPVHSLDWNADNTKLVYCNGEECFIKLLKAQTQPIKWRAHTGLVLSLSWSTANDTILSGGEDCRYRLWDGLGRPLWSSNSHGYPVTAVAWSPSGEMFAVGSFNTLRLCDRAGVYRHLRLRFCGRPLRPANITAPDLSGPQGPVHLFWSHSLEKPATGSIYCITWSPDNTQLVAGGGNGRALHAAIIGRRLLWDRLEAIQRNPNRITVQDLSSEIAKERLETRDRVVRLELGFNYLVVATTSQIYIFSAKNWNTPVIVDYVKEGVSGGSSTSGGLINLIRLAERCFLLVDLQTVQVWNYEGRVLCTIRMPQAGGGGEPFTHRTAAIANDLVVLRDRGQPSRINLFDPQTGREASDGAINHPIPVVELCVNQCGPLASRRVAFVDMNGDCFLALVSAYGAPQRSAKIGALVNELTPNNGTNMLAAFQEQRLTVWTFPTAVFVDRDLLAPTTIVLGGAGGGLGGIGGGESMSASAIAEEVGRSAEIVGFIGNTVTVRLGDGGLMVFYVPPFPAALYRLVIGGGNNPQQQRWDPAIRLCRSLRENYLWATLAAMAVQQRQFQMAELCYGQLGEAEKLQFLSELRAQSDPRTKTAMMSEFAGSTRESDSALLQAGRNFSAIMLNLAMFRFDRALELALKWNNGRHLDTVLGHRQRYLELTGRHENDPKFLRFQSQHEIDWPHIREKIIEDEEHEKQRFSLQQ